MSTPNGTGPKRTVPQREADLELIARWATEGLNGIESTARLNALRNRPDDGIGYTLTPQQVRADLRTVEARWQANQIASFDQHRNRALAKLDHIQRLAFEQWYKSCQEIQSTLTEQTDPLLPPRRDDDNSPLPIGLAGRRRAQIKKEQRLGDPRYLTVIIQCEERRAKLLGLDAAISVELMVQREAERIARENGLTVDAVMRELKDILKLGEMP